jgi:hypothetical protein
MRSETLIRVDEALIRLDSDEKRSIAAVTEAGRQDLSRSHRGSASVD